MFGGLTELEVLAVIGGITPSSPYEIVRQTFRELAGDDENNWRKFLHDGFLAGSAWPKAAAQHDPGELAKALGQLKPLGAAPAQTRLDVVFYRDAKMDDGRHNNNGWLQELPDPITKLTWDNAVLLSPKTARDLGVFTKRLGQNQKFFNYRVDIRLNGVVVSGPVWVQPGMADNTIGLALGYGREKTGRVGRGAGFNAYPLRTSDALYYTSGAELQNTQDMSYELADTQSHWHMEGRPVVREANLDQYRKQPDFAKSMRPEAPARDRAALPESPGRAESNAMHQWGMSIDLNRCVGCSACMIACQSENNIPIVGKEMVGKSREMHWIRIDRYYAGTGKESRRGPAGGDAADALPALRSGPVRKCVPGQRHLARRRRLELDDL